MKATETNDPCSGLLAGEGGWQAMELGLGSNAMEIQAWHAASKPSSPAGKPEQGSGRMCIRRLAANLLHLPASWRGVEEAINRLEAMEYSSVAVSESVGSSLGPV